MEVVYVPKAFKFINNLPGELSNRVSRTIDLLETYGHALRLPDSRALGRGLFELRTVGAVQVRLLFFFAKDKAIIVHALIKKQQKLDQRDIKFARKEMENIIASI